MALYPATPKPANAGFTVEAQWNTIIAPFDGGGEQRDAKWDFARYNVTLKYNPQDKPNFEILWAFYMARKGAMEAFDIMDRVIQPHVGQYVTVTDGVLNTFDIPGVSTSAHAIYLMGLLQTSGYTILYGGGRSGSDRVQFTVTPPAGVLVTADFTGYLRMRVRYAEDRLSREHFARALFGPGGITLKGLAPE